MENSGKKNPESGFKSPRVACDVRDAIMDFIAHWSERTEIRALQLVRWMGLSLSALTRWAKTFWQAGPATGVPQANARSQLPQRLPFHPISRGFMVRLN
jgi:hypothetical protein